MSYLPVIVLASLAFGLAAFALRLPRPVWALFGATLLFGLSGYALQGSPGLAGAPRGPVVVQAGEGEQIVAARRALFDTVPENRFVTVSDAFARRGQFSDAAGILRGSLSRAPNDPETWLALGNALVEHAQGQVTPAAIYAYDRAQRLQPKSPGPGLFLGVALVRAGRLAEARTLWAGMLENAPPDAPWRAELAQRIAMLDGLIAQGGGAQ